MATIATLDGILQPQLQNRFNVIFTDASGKMLSFGSAISKQVIAVSKIRQSGVRQFGGHFSGEVTIRVEDDAACQCIKAVNELFQVNFTIHVNTLNGEGQILFTKKLVDCTLNEVLYAENDYHSPKAAVNNLQIDYRNVEIVFPDASND